MPRPGTCLRPPRRSQAPPAAAHAFLRGPATPPGKRPACCRTCRGPPPMRSATAPPPHPLRRRGARATTPTFRPSCTGTYPALGRQRYRGGEAGPIACGGRRLPPGRSRAGVEEINFWLIPRLSGPSHDLCALLLRTAISNPSCWRSHLNPLHTGQILHFTYWPDHNFCYTQPLPALQI